MPPRPPREIDFADLLGARALAWAGGVVTLLGVVFFFVLAVNRGWIGPVERVALGGLASLLVFGAGLAMRRYGQLYSAFAAVGAGLAGGYATLLAAAALYELVPDLVALGIAAAIGALGVWTALRWSSETIAGIGLIGAMLVPLSVVFEGGITIVGTAFALLMLMATAIVALRRDWAGLLAVGGVASLAQASWLVLQEGEGAAGSVVALAAAFWLVTLAIGVARQLGARSAELDRLAVAFLLASTAFAGSAAARLLNGELLGASRQGLALAAVAGVIGLVAGMLFQRDRARDLSALLGALCLTAAAVAFADLLGGQTLAIVWAGQAALLAWLASRIGETRYHVAALAYLALAAGHAVVLDAPLRDLLTETAHPASGLAAVVGVALGALVFGRFARRWPPVEPGSGPFGRTIGAALASFARLRPTWRVGAFSAAAVLGLYALALGLLELFGESFDWGHVAVTASWAAIAAAVLGAGVRTGRTKFVDAGLVWLAVTVVKLIGFDVGALRGTELALAALAVAAALLLSGLRLERPASALSPAGGVLLVASAVIGAGGALTLVTGPDADGLALLALAALYAGLAAWTHRTARDLATLLGVLGLLLGLGASDFLLEDTSLVAAWSIAAAVLAWLGMRIGEARLQPAALAFGALALTSTVVELAPPVDLFVAHVDPASGVPALLFCLGAILALTRFGPEQWRTWAVPAAGLVALYAGSLTLLGAAVWTGGADLETEFQRGHTAVSAFWGVVGLLVLYAGLRRHASSLRLAGFALFGISLAKIFLYDLARLSSVARAGSFLAVGAVLLLGGFFYQRLSAGLDERRARPL